MIISKGSEYAIRAIIYLRDNKGGKKTIDEICRGTNTPQPLLAKILQVLVSHGILVSRKGPNGGFYLDERKEKESIAIKDIPAIFSAKTYEHNCLLDNKPCDSKEKCELHSKYFDCLHGIQEFHNIKIV